MAGIYIHIPFCKSRCAYCDFHSGTDFSLKDKYINALCAELHIRKNYFFENVKTVYFGGGTPSLLKYEDFLRILNAVNENYSLSQNTEMTIEANPDDISKEYVEMLRGLGFNRISIGIQSFNDKELQLINRRHSAEKAREAVKNCQKAGFQNISIDLIYGLPAQTLETWENNLNEAIALDVQHISAYHLTYEKGTKICQMLEKNEIRQVSEETSLEMFKMLTGKLKSAGFEHYEISNFAQKGFRSQHNSAYWNDEKYIGVGTAAHSYNGISRQWNVSDTKKYIDGKSFFEIEDLTETEKYNDFVITRLRTCEGIDLSVLKEKFGEKLLQYCLKNAEKWIATRHCIYTCQARNDKTTNARLVLTEKGIFVSDCIFEGLIFA
ncbi:MAG: radical SAM family heme chaperone HemW [Prevotellaceae bacterium]|jgi:oxygen-independent coproporphyrinogen-3 oxidase|nr:radical SAM family heme chaperone HemW [Prevotellaceae bacterium]